MHVYSINGKHLASETMHHDVTHLTMADNLLLVANAQGTLLFKDLVSLRTVTSLDLLVSITMVTVTEKCSHVLVALQDGKLIVIQKDGPPKLK